MTNPPPRGWFVTGTDTDVGKTLVSTALIDWLARAGNLVSGFKPVAAGCEETADGLQNGDALLMQRASNPTPDYKQLNPVALAPPIAPHIAAAQIGRQVSVNTLAQQASRLGEGYEHLVVEGAGGWLVPLNDSETLADLAATLNYPVILVVAMRLGCINHALLSAMAIENSNLRLAGWVANCQEPAMPALQQNIETLSRRLNAPLLGILPRLDSTDTASVQQHIGFHKLTS